MFSHKQSSSFFLPARGARKHRGRSAAPGKRHMQGFQLLHQTHALSVPRLETHKNIFSLTDNPRHDSSSLLSHHVIVLSYPMDTRFSSSSGPGGLLRQGCGLDVTRGPAGNRGSLPPATKRSNKARRALAMTAHVIYTSCVCLE